MTLPEWANVATIIGVLSIPLSAFFIWLQLRQQTLLAKVANTQSLVELSSPFNLQLIQDPKMAEYWVHGAEQYQSFDPVEQYRYKSLLIWWLILHENIFFQWKSGLLDKTIYESWQYDLEKFALYQLRERWTELKPAFQSDFVRHVEGLIGKAEPDRASSRRGEYQMKQNVMLTITSLLSILLLTFHLTDDIARGMEPGGLSNYTGVLILVVWLYGTLVLAERRSGYVILLLGSLLGAGVPVIHMMGKGVGEIAKSSGGFFFVWTLLALGVTALFSLILSVRGLWSLRRGQPR